MIKEIDSTETKLDGMTAQEWRVRYAAIQPTGFHALLSTAFPRVAELEKQNEFLKDQLLNLNQEMANMETQIEKMKKAMSKE